MHYGYEFRYDINDVDADDPLTESIPSSCDKLWVIFSHMARWTLYLSVMVTVVCWLDLPIHATSVCYIVPLMLSRDLDSRLWQGEPGTWYNLMWQCLTVTDLQKTNVVGKKYLLE
jgi:hypothetical protein